MSRPSEEAEEFTQSLTESVGFSGEFSSRAFMNWHEVLEMLNSGIDFGSHTLNHVVLTQMEPARALTEIRDSRRELQEHLGCEVSAFSYPWGIASALTRQAVVESGYSCAVGTRPGGLAKTTDDRWLLPRIAISNSVVADNGQFSPDKALVSCVKSVLVANSKRLVQRTSKQEKENQRIKVAFVIDQISEWEGGTERQLKGLIELLDRRYFDPELFFIFRSPELPTETLPCAARWICPDADLRGSFYTRLFRLARALRKFGPDIVQTFFIEGIFAGTIAGRLAGVPAVVVSRRNSGHWTKVRHRIAFRAITALASNWQSNSRAGWDHLNTVQKVPSRRIELLPNAVDLSRFTPPSETERCAARRRLGINGQARVFVSVAALTAVKDFHTLLSAASRIKTEMPTAQIIIVGDGPLREDLENYSEQLDLRGMIRFVGRQSDVRPYLAAADFAVLTSKSEGSSNSVLEYMAMGLPSVLSDIPPNRELASGLLFEPGNDADLADKLLSITKDAPLCSRLKREYLAVANQYSVERFTLRAQSYYSRLAAGFVY